MGVAPETKTRWGARLRRCFLWLIGLCVGGVFFMEILIHTTVFPEATGQPLPSTPVLYDAEGGVLATLPQGNARTRVVGNLKDMGRWLPEVTVALEDHRFYSHSGIDPYAIAAAAWSDLRAGRLRRGGSTITQQVIKQDLGKRGRQWRRKWLEAILALKLERIWSKDEVLEGYLNRLDYGNRRLGAESASMAYFGKRCASLTLAESIYLAGLPQAPSRYNPWRNPESAERKYHRSIKRLLRVSYLTSPQVSALTSAPPKPGNFTQQRLAPHFLEALKRSSAEPLQGSIQTSLDSKIQQQTEQELASHLESLNRHDVRNGAVVVIENATGQVRALTNFATQAAQDTAAINSALKPRNAGSTLKPFVYQHALEERRLTAATVLTDTAEAVTAIYPDYDPKNYNKRYYGPVRMREALGNSLNIPAVLASHRVGARRASERLAHWGLRSHAAFGADGAGFVLGNRRVTLLDLTYAYSTLARGGTTYGGPSYLAEDRAAPRRIADRQACRLIEDILCDNRARAQAFGSRSVLRFPSNRRTAVKTGTSSNFRDAWVVGYNASHTVGVWVGNLNGRGMDKALSVNVAGPIWRRMMDWLGETFPSPGSAPLSVEQDGLLTLEIDALNGAVPVPETRQSLHEWFLPDSAPNETTSTWYQDGQIILPDAYATWTQSSHNHLQAKTRSPWTITNPRDGAHYTIDPALPSEQQTLPFLSDHPKSETLTWLLNDLPIKTTNWPLSTGTWTLQAQDPASARVVSVSFVVE